MKYVVQEDNILVTLMENLGLVIKIKFRESPQLIDELTDF